MNASPGVVVAVLATAHLTIRFGLGIGDVAPDLFALAVLVAGRSMRMSHAAALGFGLGLLQDAFTERGFGASPLALTAVGAAASYTRQLFVGDSVIFVASYFFVGKWVVDVIRWLASDEAGWAALADRVLMAAPLAALYAAVVGLALHFLFLKRPRAP